jgi:hypothetical protein
LAAFTAEFFLPPLVRQDRKLFVIAIFAGALEYAALGREMELPARAQCRRGLG